MVKAWWVRLRGHRFWGLSLIAWWLILQGAGFALASSFALVGGTSPEGLLFVAGPAVMCLMAGINIRNRHPSGWSMGVLVFGLELAMVLTGNFSTAMGVFAGSDPPDVALRILLQDMLLPSLLTALPLIYLVRPKVKAQFWH